MNKKNFKGLIISCLIMTLPVFAAKKNSVSDADVAVPVEVITVQQGSVPVTITSLGSLKAVQQVDISPETSGQIAHIGFVDGQRVNQGRLLFQLDDSLLKAQLMTAEAKLRLSKVSYQRQARLIKSHAISQDMLDQARAQLEQDQGAYQEILIKTQQMQLLAPFNGMVESAAVSVGQYVTVGQALVTLVGLDQLNAIYNLPQSDLALLQLGQSVVVKADTFPNVTFTGTVSYIAPAVDATTRTVEVHALINNDHQQLIPGMFVKVQQMLSNRTAIVVPDQAIVTSISNDQVYVIKNNQAVLRTVTVGMRWKNQVEILSGLSAGEKLVIAGQQRLRDGAMVSIAKGAA